MLCGSLDGRGVWVRMDTSVCTAESLCCSPETITTLLTGIPQYKIKSLKKNSIVLAQKKTHRSTRNREPRNKPIHLYQLTYDKGSKNTQRRKDSLFNKWCWITGQLHLFYKIKLEYFFILLTKRKWIKDLNVKLESIRLQENIENTL